MRNYMKTLIATTPNCLVYDDGEPLGNRSSTTGVLLLPFTLEFAPNRGGIVIKGTRIQAGMVWRYVREVGYSYGNVAGSFSIDEGAARDAVEFCDNHPDCIEPADEEAPWWLDPPDCHK